MTQRDMVALVLAMTLVSIIVRLLCYNPALGAEVNTTSRKLFGG